LFGVPKSGAYVIRRNRWGYFLAKLVMTTSTRPPSVALPRTIPAVLPRQFDHVCDQTFIVSTPQWHSTLRGPVLAQNPA